MNNNINQQQLGKYIAMSLPGGCGLGIAIGAAIKNIGAGIAMGAGIGIVIGLAIYALRKAAKQTD